MPCIRITCERLWQMVARKTSFHPTAACSCVAREGEERGVCAAQRGADLSQAYLRFTERVKMAEKADGEASCVSAEALPSHSIIINGQWRCNGIAAGLTRCFSRSLGMRVQSIVLSGLAILSIVPHVPKRNISRARMPQWWPCSHVAISRGTKIGAWQKG
jgi:hypothetical protein